MKCPFCGSENSNVIDSRLNRNTNQRRRRYVCITCGKKYSSYEFLVEDFNLIEEYHKEIFNEIIKLAIRGGGMKGD